MFGILLAKGNSSPLPWPGVGVELSSIGLGVRPLLVALCPPIGVLDRDLLTDKLFSVLTRTGDW